MARKMSASRPRLPAVESRTKPLTQPSKIWKEKPMMLMRVDAAPTASSPVAMLARGLWIWSGCQRGEFRGKLLELA